MEVRLLGPLEVTVSGRVVEVPGQRLRALLSLLALDAGRVVSVERLLDAIYGEDLPQQAENALQQAVSKLRRRLAEAGDEECLVTRPPGYLLDVRPEDVDALRFEELVSEAARRASDDPAGASAAYAEALDLWRGEALPDLPSTDVVLPLRARLDERRLTAVEDRVDLELELGHHAEQVAELDALVADEPLRERRWGQLMLALYRSGRQADALRAYRRAQDTLVEELGIEPGPELRALEGRILAQDEALAAATPVAPPTAPARPRSNLRAALGPCLGREHELARLQALVDDHRLVTIVATGGAGKTRIALELGHRLRETEVDGVWWVDLAPVTDRPALVDVLRRTSGLPPGDELDELAAVLAPSSAVLVFDNCEQVVDDAAAVVDELLGRCPSLRIVATSREGLGVPGEVLFPLPALDLDAAVQVFATRLPPGTAADDDTVRAICERLDGLPLAIELAAARSRHLGLPDILDRLEDRFEVLSAGPRTAQARQRSLKAVVDWSYDLLDEDERRVFPRLAVFRDGVPLSAAARICADEDLPPATVEDVLMRLADKSLVILDTTGPTTRLRLLQTLVDYGDDRLDERGDRDDAERRRAEWIVELARPVALIGFGKWQEFHALQQEDANISGAAEWALRRDHDLAIDLAAELGWFWFVSLQVGTGWQNVRAALATAGGDADQRARAGSMGSLLGAICGDLEAAEALSQQAIAHERARGEPLGLAAALMVDGAWRGMRGEAEDAFAALGEADELARANDLHQVQPFIQFQHGVVHLVMGDLEEAKRHFEQVMAATAEDDVLGQASLHVRLGDVAMRRDRLEEARDHFEAARRIDPDGMIHALSVEATARLARVSLDLGDPERAAALADDALRRTQEGYLLGVSGLAFQTSGVVNARRGRFEQGIAELEAAVARFAAAGARPSEVMALDDLAEAQEAAGAADAAATTRERALSVLDSLRKAGDQRAP